MKVSSSMFVLLIFILSCSKDAELSTDQISLLSAINDQGIMINDKPLEISDDELSILDEIGNVKLIGLGEASHGTKEFFQMKLRVFKYLVENHGFKAFLFETDFVEGRILNDWVQWRRNDDVVMLMEDTMLFDWYWKTKEVKEVLEYIRAYNQNKSESDMIGFYGVDTQFPDYDLGVLADILTRSNISEVDSILSKNVKHQELSPIFILKLSMTSRVELKAELAEGTKYAMSIVSKNEEKIKSALGEEEFLWAIQLVRHMEQVQEVNFATSINAPELRDKYMAENTEWYFDLLGEDSKFALWAHNYHIANNAENSKSGSQGFYLKEKYGNDYQIIGFSLGVGSFTAEVYDFENASDVENSVFCNIPSSVETHTLNSDILETSSNYLLYRSELDNFILKTNTQDPDLNSWLNKSKPFLLIGGGYDGNTSEYYQPRRLMEEYDFIIHFDNTTNSELLSN